MTGYTPDPALVELIARATFASDYPTIGGSFPWGDVNEREREDYRRSARVALAALATEGRLLPGPLLAVHTTDGRVYHPSDVKFEVGPWQPTIEENRER